MQKLQIFVYKIKGNWEAGLVRNPEHLPALGLAAAQDAAVVTPPLPSSQAYQALAVWKRRIQSPLGRLRRRLVSRPDERLPRAAESSLEETDEALGIRLCELLAGRIVPEHRLVGVLRDEGFWPSQISRALDRAVFRGEIIQLPGFTARPWGEQACSRCGSTRARALPCPRCGGLECLLCLECSSLGEHRGCSTLLAVPGSAASAALGEAALVLDYELTPAQQAASLELVDFWEQRQERALVWAACGAGKTEVTFALIQRALEEGAEVLFAIPRQDIVREMAQRLRSAFPEVEVAAHFGGQPWLAPGRLVVATTHQVLHFYQRFGLAILDEVDAFPYQGSEMLRFGLQRALHPQGQLVEMTATPTGPRPQRVITIPARHHGHPLPEPQIIVEKLPPWPELTGAALPPAVVDSLAGSEHPWLVFAPTIAACTALEQVLAQALTRKVGLCHAKLEGRRRVVDEFRRGLLDVLVTTSVLERGVNFPGVGVMVLYADHSLFSVSALVQMAGRVGRSADAPSGPVLFVAAKRTPAMREASALIRQLNEEAERRGLLTGAGTE
ncbi:MAG: DEAD/DEAH box helicase family protein [Firmicutes bacterium]|nr:DEAD/DEAH box helicase family protein [Bacillota bacterium]